MLTAAVRDLHRSCPGQFETDIRTPCPALWENNPYITPIQDEEADESIDCNYPLIHRSNTGPWHFIHGFAQSLSSHLGVSIEPTAFKGDLHISQTEKEWLSQVQELTKHRIPFWIIVAGGKFDFTAKWWPTERYQQVVKHFKGQIMFVQVGEAGHHHPPLSGVLDFRGKTNLRQMVRLMYHAQGVLCPVTFHMHLAAAVETPVGMPQNRPCVVVAGGREPSQWEAYPHHQYIHNNGALLCCDNGGCWQSRVVPLGDGDQKDMPENLCVDVVHQRDPKLSFRRKPGSKPLMHPPQSDPKLYLPKCLDMISVEAVVRRISMYFEGGAVQYLSADTKKIANQILQL